MSEEKVIGKNPSYTVIQLDKPRTLRYTLKSLYILEETAGKSLTELFNPEEITKLSLKMVALLLWAGLIHEDPEITEEQVIDLMDQSPLTLTEMVEVISSAFVEQVSKKVGGAPFEKKKIEKIKKQTGKK